MPATTRRYYAFFKLDSDDAALFDRRLTDALNHVAKESIKTVMALSANDYAMLVELGVLWIESEMAANLEHTESQVMAQKIQELREKKAHRDQLAEIYETMGLDEFVAWCDREGIADWQAALEEYNSELFQEKKKAPWAERAAEWLAEFLGDGHPHHIDEIKTQASVEGIVDDTDSDTVARDWAKLCVLASRKGYSSRGPRGWWAE